jgi:beta-galactosidase
MEVVVYSNCEKVTLSLNGHEIGSAETNRSNEFTAIFSVPYEPGKLVASGINGDQLIETMELVTAGEPAAIRIISDRENLAADGHGLAYLTVELVDEKGIRLPFGEEVVNFTIEGPGEIIGVGSARPNSVESFQQLSRTTFEGRCLAIVKSGKEAGEITVRAMAEGMKAATAIIRSE